jgi:SAM-dependent methyltransferase
MNKRASLVGPTDKWNVLRDFQINFLKKNGLKPHHSLIDIGCGVLRGGIPIIRYLDESNYYGLESRGFVLDEGKRELMEENLEYKNPNLMVNGDGFDDIDLHRKVDFVWAYSVLFHIADNILPECFRFVARHLNPDGVFYANVHTGVHHVVGRWKSQDMPKIRRPLKEYKTICHSSGLKQVSVIGTVADWGITQVKNAQDKPILKISL